MTLTNKPDSLPKERHKLGRLPLEEEHLIGCYHLALAATGSSRSSDVALHIVLKPEMSNEANQFNHASIQVIGFTCTVLLAGQASRG